ncbi:MAG: beta strand repeat-containing protein [Chthoniobacterales bacterium]
MKSNSITLPPLLLALLFALTDQPARAGSATWNLNPGSGDWNTAANWTPATVPNGSTDVATFDVSNQTDVSLSADVTVDSIIFNPGASAYTIAMNSLGTMTIDGAGIVNSSGVTQNFTTLTGLNSTSLVTFSGSAKAGSMTTFVNTGNGNLSAASIQFLGSSSADGATFIDEGPMPGKKGASGTIIFSVRSTGGNATFINDGGGVTFYSGTTADHATFICNGGTRTAPTGGYVIMESGLITCDHAVFTLNGTDVPGGTGGSFTSLVLGGGTANATFIANSGTVDGGLIRIPNGGGTAGNGRVELFGNGRLDTSSLGSLTVSIGSLEGDGLVFLGVQNLTVGGNQVDTTFSGVIADGGAQGGVGGSLTKTSSSSLELDGANTYTGGTTVNAGTLIVSNAAGSGTGTGAVQVNAATLGGSGTLTGAVTLNSGAFLAPAHGTETQSTLTISSPLTFNAGSTYTCTFKAKGKKAKADKVIANGVTINGGASFNLSGTTKGALKNGLTLTLISNTSANPISGTFSNLADGAIVNVNGNNLQASYEGGDGNDLTLTVVP